MSSHCSRFKGLWCKQCLRQPRSHCYLVLRAASSDLARPYNHESATIALPELNNTKNTQANTLLNTTMTYTRDPMYSLHLRPGEGMSSDKPIRPDSPRICLDIAVDSRPEDANIAFFETTQYHNVDLTKPTNNSTSFNNGRTIITIGHVRYTPIQIYGTDIKQILRSMSKMSRSLRARRR